MFAQASVLGIATLSIAAVGCTYEYEKEYEDTRLVLAAEGCPSADAITAENYGDEASFTGARTFDRMPLCWYRLEGRTTYPRPECGKSADVHDGTTVDASASTANWPTLESIRAPLRNEIPTDEHFDLPSVNGIECTDQGPVYLDVPTTPSCEALEGRSITEMHPGIKDHLVVRELLAADARPALMRCNYWLTGKYTRAFMNSK